MFGLNNVIHTIQTAFPGFFGNARFVDLGGKADLNDSFDTDLVILPSASSRSRNRVSVVGNMYEIVNDWHIVVLFNKPLTERSVLNLMGIFMRCANCTVGNEQVHMTINNVELNTNLILKQFFNMTTANPLVDVYMFNVTVKYFLTSSICTNDIHYAVC